MRRSSFAPPLQLKQMVMQETKDEELIIILLPRNRRITAKDFRGRFKGVALQFACVFVFASKIIFVGTLTAAFSFSFGYHTYLSVSDICEVRIEGLETLNYLDNLSYRKCFTEQGDAITFESERGISTIFCGECFDDVMESLEVQSKER
ncbi:hypothetical protein AgCh_007073 [Apium graveolens]